MKETSTKSTYQINNIQVFHFYAFEFQYFHRRQCKEAELSKDMFPSRQDCECLHEVCKLSSFRQKCGLLYQKSFLALGIDSTVIKSFGEDNILKKVFLLFLGDSMSRAI